MCLPTFFDDLSSQFIYFPRCNFHDEYTIVIPSSLRRNPLRTPQLMVKFPEGTNAANANLLLIFSPHIFSHSWPSL